ncbi:MAG: glutaminyl-peptide cyclotransferase [Caldilineaceae bacterium]|nr:glutaminyl-peptide cyclotransferase [Caldilineaceae bacterium]
MRLRLLSLLFLVALWGTGCSGAAAPVAAPASTSSSVPTETPAPTATATPEAEAGVKQFSYVVENAIPHDPAAFTQGLVYADDIFYEGTGLRGQSTLRKVNPETGKVIQGVRYPPDIFAEGVAVLGDKIYQLTWQSNLGYVFDKETLQAEGQFSYPTEGWGLTHDGERLIMSDGTATLYFIDPESLEITGQVAVTDDEGPVTMLNELEYIDGRVYANIWQTERIAIIDPATGRVTAYIDLAGLPDEEARTELMGLHGLANEAALANFLRTQGTLNGIAYDAATDRLFVTGKLWPKIYEIDLVE